MIVDPVVVIPDILSKNASLKVNSFGDKTKGKLPKAATITHAKVENKKVCLKFNLKSLSKLAKINNIPIRKFVNQRSKKINVFCSGTLKKYLPGPIIQDLIFDIIEHVMEKFDIEESIIDPTLDQIINADEKARLTSVKYINNIQ